MNYILIRQSSLPPSRLNSYSSRNHHIQFSMHYLDSRLYHVDTLPRSVKRECSTYIAMALELTIYTSGVSYAPYAYGTIIRTIRVWLYHMRIRVWYTFFYLKIKIIKKKKKKKRKK